MNNHQIIPTKTPSRFSNLSPNDANSFQVFFLNSILVKSALDSTYETSLLWHFQLPSRDKIDLEERHRDCCRNRKATQFNLTPFRERAVAAYAVTLKPVSLREIDLIKVGKRSKCAIAEENDRGLRSSWQKPICFPGKFSSFFFNIVRWCLPRIDRCLSNLFFLFS